MANRQDNQAIPEMETSPRDIDQDEQDRVRGGSDEEIRDTAEDEDEDFDEAEDLEAEDDEESNV